MVFMFTKTEMLEEFTVIGGLIGVQIIYAGNAVLMSYLMSLGLSSLSIVLLASFATFIVVSPLGAYFERSKWPKDISMRLVIQLVLIAFGGVLFQELFLKGINLTSPALATAMPNLAPALIFIIAWTLRLEKVKLSCIYSKVKIVGTMLCVVGALTMSLMHSFATPKGAVSLAPPPDLVFDKEKIIGCIFLMAAVFFLSTNVVLQATTLGIFPAPVSICAITSLIGVVVSAFVQLLQDHKLDIGWPLLSFRDLVGYALLGGGVNGVCVSFNGWAIKKKGPVLVSMFNPIGTVVSVVLTVVTLGTSVKLGSLAGMFIMFTGLYFVLWAKGKESNEDRHAIESEFDAQKPLLI